MKPKEKAKALFDKMYKADDVNSNYPMCFDSAKQCSLIAVDECIESTKQLIHHYTKGDDKRYTDIYLSMSLSVAYWQEVKQEIELL